MSSRRRLAVLALALVWVESHSAGYQPQFQSRVEYVVVDAVVTDGRGRSVEGLTIADFEILEAGRPQRISDFRFVSVPVPTAAAPALFPAPSDVATNTPLADTSRLFAVVIDDLHILAQHVSPLKAVLNAFLDGVRPADLVAVVFVGRSDLSVPFTNDQARLRRTVEGGKASVGFALDPMQIGGREDRLNLARSATATLRNVATAMASSSFARRAVLYVSSGVGIDIEAFGTNEAQDAMVVRSELDDVFRQAADSNVPIYTVDPRGMATAENSQSDSLAVSSADDRAETSRRIRIQQDFLSSIAVSTGGRAYNNQSSVSGAVRNMLEDNGSFYVLGYYPTPFTADGKFKTIEVKVRRPGVQVRARKGYIAHREGAVGPTAQLDAALGRSVQGGALQVRGVAVPLAASGRGAEMLITLMVNLPARAGASYDDEFHVGLVAVNRDGKVQGQSRRVVRFRLPPRKDADHRVTINEIIALPRGEMTIRAGVSSKAADQTGVVHIRAEVPDPGARIAQLSPIVVGLEGPPRGPIARPQVIAGRLPFQPVTYRNFSSTDVLRVAVRAFLRAGSDPPAVTAQLQRESSATLRAVVVEKRQVLASVTDYVGEIRLQGLEPGGYLLHMGTEPANTRVLSFRVQ